MTTSAGIFSITASTITSPNGEPSSNQTSASESKVRSCCDPDSVLKSILIPDLFAFLQRKPKLSPFGPNGAVSRSDDPLIGSTSTTFAPKSASKRPHSSPRLFVVSTTRNPSSGFCTCTSAYYTRCKCVRFCVKRKTRNFEM